ncbi:YncE family protein [Desulfitobacterium sp. THU1]|uniref:YncE family protein n=1 Tax=Desulfitobacterium sp. THU1 TaxID=3138072 RepID=UPI00311DAF2B
MMTVWTTGEIRNPVVAGLRQIATLSVRYRNASSQPAVVEIRGYYFERNARIEYVMDSMTLIPGEVKDTQHYAQFDAWEFRFMTTSDDVGINVWGKNRVGNMIATYPVCRVDNSLVGQGRQQGKDILGDRLYQVCPEYNRVDVLDKYTHMHITTIPVGLNPMGVGENPLTDRVYVANQGSHNVSVIDGATNAVIATVLVGTSPTAVRVDAENNRIYVTNQGSKTISVINGTTHTVVATINNR